MTDRENFEAWFVGVAAEMKLFGAKDLEIAHRKAKDWFCWQAALASQQPADDGWVYWTGGESPVNGETVVYVKFRDGDVDEGGTKACNLDWTHAGECWDIIAYRVVKP